MEKTKSARESPQELKEPTQESAFPCDDGAISPASRKIIEQCTITIAPIQNKEVRSFITRPPSSGLESTDFQFARPNIAGRAFTARSQLNPHSHQVANTDSQAPVERVKPSNLPDVSPPEKRGSHNGKQDCGTTASSGPEGHSLSSESGDARMPKPAEPVPELSRQGQSTTNSESSLSCRTENTRNSQPASVLPKRFQNAPVKTPSYPQNGVARTSAGIDKTPSNGKKPPAKAKSPLLSPSVRVSKSPRHGAKGETAPAPRIRDGSGLRSQASEEELFYLLIHKLKKRDEAELAAAALKEQLHAQIQEFKSANGKLRVQLRDVERRYSKQESENLAQRSLIERWKLKLGKLKNLMSSICGEQEAIRKDGERIREEQASLNEEKQGIHDEIRHLSDNTSEIGKRLSQHKAQLSGIHCESNSLEQSLLSAKDKIAEREQVLHQERNRVAILEGFIRNQSSKIQRQSAEVYKNQLKAVSRLDSICEHIDHSRDDTHVTMEKDIIPAINGCREAIESLSKKGYLGPSDLVPIESSVDTISRQLNTCIQSTINEINNSANMQNSNVKAIVTKLDNLNATFQQKTEIYNQLAQAEGQNRNIREDLTSAEANLRKATEECNSSKSREVTLTGHIKELEFQLSVLKDQLAETSSHEADAYEMRLKLEACSSALYEAREEVKTKESALCEIIGQLDEAKKKLGISEIEISRLESDKRTMEKEACDIEQKVRQELTRASLMSKDQNRAWFEQEKHKLEREKAAAEKQVSTIEKQIDTMKSDLARANEVTQELTVVIHQRKREIEEMKETRTKELSKHESEIMQLQEREEASRRDRDSMEAKLIQAVDESEKLKKDLEGMREESDQVKALLATTESAASSREANLMTLQDELQEAKRDAEQVAGLRLELAQYLQNAEPLQEQLDLAMKREKEAADKSKTETSEIAADLENRVNTQEQRIRELQDELQEAGKWPAEIRMLLQEHGLLTKDVSFAESMKVLKAQLGGICERPHPEMVSEKPGMKISRGARRKRKRGASATPKKKAPASTQEFQATELIFRTNSVVNTPSPHKTTAKNFTPKKKQTKPLPRIRPFSKIEWEPITQNGSPVCFVPQLGSDPLANAGVEPRGSSLAQPGPMGLGDGPGREEISKEKRVRTHDQLDEEGKESGNMHAENSKRRCIKDDAGSVNAHNSQPGGAMAVQQGRGVVIENGDQEVDGNTSCQQEETGADATCRKGPLKGILKDTALPAKPSRVVGEMCTPSLSVDGGRTSIPSAAPRRQTRVPSRFFDPQLSPSPSLSIVSNNRETWTVKQSVDTFISRSRERNRRKRKGDLYNERFNQKLPA